MEAWSVAENLTPNGIRSRDRPARRQSLYRLRYPDPPTGLTLENYTLCLQCIYVFCTYLRTNSDLCHLQHKLNGFYNRDEKCLQRGTDWGFK